MTLSVQWNTTKVWYMQQHEWISRLFCWAKERGTQKRMYYIQSAKEVKIIYGNLLLNIISGPWVMVGGVIV